MELYNRERYTDNLLRVSGIPVDWQKLCGASVMISGATGLIGSFLIDVLMLRNRNEGLNCRVVALGRSAEKAKYRFARYWEDPLFAFRECDIVENGFEGLPAADYIFHLASNTHPVAYATDPIGTITANIIGTRNLLEFGAASGVKRVVFASSVEIYGENRGDQDYFTEDYCGYIDCNTLRAGYPESKRAGEALCQAYIRQKGMDIVIPRLSRTYGPTMLMTDSKALSQFIRKGLAGEDIVLKSEGTQFFSYSYVGDAVAGLLYCLSYGACGEAYNIADADSDITLRDLAGLIAGIAGRKVVFELPDAVERAGYSKATKAVLCADKLKAFGWQAMWDIRSGLRDTMEILR